MSSRWPAASRQRGSAEAAGGQPRSPCRGTRSSSPNSGPALWLTDAGRAQARHALVGPHGHRASEQGEDRPRVAAGDRRRHRVRKVTGQDRRHREAGPRRHGGGRRVPRRRAGESGEPGEPLRIDGPVGGQQRAERQLVEHHEHDGRVDAVDGGDIGIGVGEERSGRRGEQEHDEEQHRRCAGVEREQPDGGPPPEREGDEDRGRPNVIANVVGAIGCCVPVARRAMLAPSRPTTSAVGPLPSAATSAGSA